MNGLAEVLAAHCQWTTPRKDRMGTDRRWFCICGAQLDDDYSGVNIVNRHRAHVAEQIAAHLAERLAAPEMNEAVRDAIRGGDMTRHDITTAALTAVYEALTTTTEEPA